jgi:ADP-ribose pyrophosphatase YjhB (NUDIX family)
MGKVYDLTWNYQTNLLASFAYAADILIQIKISHLAQLLDEISHLSQDKPKSITILVSEQSDISLLLKQYFKLIKAAGGIVAKGEQILMIYRAHNWDLPKGRIEKGESILNAAVREVNEECGVKVAAKAKFYTTWHAFQADKTNILKETTWYLMDCLDDTHMAPQKEEAIERVAWIDTDKLAPILENTYANITLLLQAYKNNQHLMKT